MEGDDNFFVLSTSASVGDDGRRPPRQRHVPRHRRRDPAHHQHRRPDEPVAPDGLPAPAARGQPDPRAAEIEGSTGGRPDRALVRAVILPTEADTGPHSLNLPPVDEATSIDRLNVFNDGSTANDVGTLTGTTLTGLGSTGGITYLAVEILDVLLGTGNDTFTINGTMTPDGVQGGITVVHGGAGDDTIAVKPAAGSGSTTVTLASPLVIYGDTSQDGGEYNDVPGAPAPYAPPLRGRSPATTGTSSTPAPRSPAWPSTAASTTTRSPAARASDYLAGGSGDDVIHGNGGDDIVYGDSGFNAVFFGSLGFPAGAARNTRDVAVPTVNATRHASRRACPEQR